MKYKPEETTWMAYLYGELEGAEKEKVEQYLMDNPEARRELEKFQDVSRIMGTVKDKEVIAPPIFIDDHRNRFTWNTGYVKTILSIAASLLLIMIVGKVTDTHILIDNNEFRITFGEPEKVVDDKNVIPQQQPMTLTTNDVQQMINNSLDKSNEQMQSNWELMQQKFDASVKTNLASNSTKVDKLLQNTSSASQEQIRDYVASLQAQNMEMVKDYFQLTSNEQKQYIEDLLVDFAKYLQQQRSNDIQLLQTRISNIEQNNDMFQQETEQILSSIISNTSLTTVKN